MGIVAEHHGALEAVHHTVPALTVAEVAAVRLEVAAGEVGSHCVGGCIVGAVYVREKLMSLICKLKYLYSAHL